MQKTTRTSARQQNAPNGDALVKGASRGFTVLLLGGAVQPLVGVAVPPLGYVWLVIVAVAAFVWSASIATRGGAPTVYGVTAAFGSYALVLPVVVLGGGLNAMQVGYTTVLAVIVGFVVGSLNSAQAAVAKAVA